MNPTLAGSQLHSVNMYTTVCIRGPCTANSLYTYFNNLCMSWPIDRYAHIFKSKVQYSKIIIVGAKGSRTKMSTDLQHIGQWAKWPIANQECDVDEVDILPMQNHSFADLQIC